MLRAIAGEATYVVTDDNEVESFARDLGAKTLREDAPGLNVAVAHAYRELSSLTQEIIIVHADLAKPEGLGTFPFTNDATVIRDHTGTGTNVLRLPSGLDATFFYGPDSAQRHVGELTRLGLAVQNVTDSPFGFDVDEPGDLHWS